MGFLKGLFGGAGNDGGKEESTNPWVQLNSLVQLQTIKENSKGDPQYIFKHSTSCGISRMVLNRFERGHDFSLLKGDLYYLDLLANRDVSNAVAQEFNVIHQSPQLLVIKNGMAVAHASHSDIAGIDIFQYV